MTLKSLFVPAPSVERSDAVTPLPRGVAVACAIAYVLLAACAFAFARGGHVQQDEGWYVAAAREVLAGRLPYRDFMYTQGPLHPYLYGLGQLVLGPGLVAGRTTSLLLFLVATAIAAAVARRLGGATAALIALALIGSSAMTFWVWTLPLTHAAAGTFLIAGIALLVGSEQNPGREAAGLLALALGTAVRLSLLGALVLAVAWIGWRRRSLPAFVRAAGIAAACLIVLIGPFAFASPSGFQFGVWEYHALRTRQYSPHPGPVEAAVWWHGKIEFLVGLARHYGVVVVAALAALFVVLRGRSPGFAAERDSLAGIAAIVLVTLAITMIPHPVHVTYAGLLVPAASVLAGAVLAPVVNRMRGRTALVWGAVALLAAGGVGIARSCDPAELERVVRAGQAIDRALPPGPVLTFQNTLLAGTDRARLPGFEMGPFAFWPHFDDARAARLRVVNTAKLCELVRGRTAIALAITSRERWLLGLPCGGESLAQAVARGYVEVPALRVDGFGQYGAPRDGGDVLYVLVRREQ